MLKNFIKSIIFPHRWSSEAYATFLRKKGCKIGDGTYFYDPRNTLIDENNLEFIEIGCNCQITSGVKILGHDYSYSVLANVYGELLRPQKVTRIGDNVFIGMSAVILMGAVIGDNVIIGSSAVVSGEVKSNSVYAGNPAKYLYSLDDYYEKNKRGFVSSAKVYAQQFYVKNKRYPKIEEMNIYRTLFCSEEELKAYVLNANYIGVSLESKKHIKMNFPYDFSSVEELLDYKE